MLYHATQGAVIVPDVECEQSLPAGWSNTPPESVTSVAPTVVRLMDIMLAHKSPAAVRFTTESAKVDKAAPDIDKAIPQPDIEPDAKRKPGRPRKASD